MDGRDPFELAEQLEHAWGCWAPSMTPDARQVAYVSDRGGVPRVCVQSVGPDGADIEPVCLDICDDPVIDVEWSADRAWLSVAVATDGGVRQQVWVVRPDGRDAKLVAGSRDVHAELGPWARSGHSLVVTIPSAEPGQPTQAFLVDPNDASRRPLTSGELFHVLDLSLEERFVLVVAGRRGEQYCVIADQMTEDVIHLLPEHGVGSTEVGMIRPSPPDGGGPLTCYLVTDVGAERRRLVSVAFGPNGFRGPQRVIAEREDAELESVDADDDGSLLALTWNVNGRSEVELIDTWTGARTEVVRLPGMVADGLVLSRDGSSVFLTVEGPDSPRRLWHLDTTQMEWAPVTAAPPLPTGTLVEPQFERFEGHGRSILTGWLYQPPVGSWHGGAVVHFHGGPEAQERPGFAPQHQALAAAGWLVFAPNIRGSSGFGRRFVHADDREKRFDGLADAVAAGQHLRDLGADRVVVTGRSYGGYLTFAMLAFHPDAYDAGMAVCGMSDLRTFYRDTEPWIADAAISKYGDPDLDADLLERLSPLTKVDDVRAPLLVAHGELDTNVPFNESQQFVDALVERRQPVELLTLPGEGHVYRRADSRAALTTSMLSFLKGVTART